MKFKNISPSIYFIITEFINTALYNKNEKNERVRANKMKWNANIVFLQQEQEQQKRI